MKLSKKKDAARKWRAFKRNVLLVVEPLIIALATVAIWHWLWVNGYHFNPADETAITLIISTLGVPCSIIATIVMSSTWSKYRKVMLSALEKDKRTFMLYRDERMPIFLHVFLAALALPLLGMVLGLNFRSEWSGIASIFSVVFVFALYRVVLVQLENPTRSAWLIERVPANWLKEDVDKYFALENGQGSETEEAVSVGRGALIGNGDK